MIRLGALLCSTACLLGAAGYPAPVAGDWVVHDFRFHDGSTLPDLRLPLHDCRSAIRATVLMLHGQADRAQGC